MLTAVELLVCKGHPSPSINTAWLRVPPPSNATNKPGRGFKSHLATNAKIDPRREWIQRFGRRPHNWTRRLTRLTCEPLSLQYKP